LIVFLSGNKRQMTGARNTGAGLIVLAVLVILVSYFVETDKERVTRQSRELIHAVNDRDWNKMRSLLDPRVSLAVLSSTIYADRDQLVKGAQMAVDQYGLKSVTITSLDTQQTQTVITVNVDVLTVQDFSMGRPIPSSWQFEWEQSGKEWSLFRITCLKVANEQGPQVQSRFPK
jgi:hypothetical protein